MPYKPNKIGPYPLWNSNVVVSQWPHDPLPGSSGFVILNTCLFSAATPDDFNDLTFHTDDTQTLRTLDNTGFGTVITAEAAVQKVIVSITGSITVNTVVDELTLWPYLALTDNNAIVANSVTPANPSGQYIILPHMVDISPTIAQCSVNTSVILDLNQPSDKFLIAAFNLGNYDTVDRLVEFAGSISIHKYIEEIVIQDSSR